MRASILLYPLQDGSRRDGHRRDQQQRVTHHDDGQCTSRGCELRDNVDCVRRERASRDANDNESGRSRSLEDRIVSTPGTYSATATLAPAGSVDHAARCVPRRAGNTTARYHAAWRFHRPTPACGRLALRRGQPDGERFGSRHRSRPAYSSRSMESTSGQRSLARRTAFALNTAQFSNGSHVLTVYGWDARPQHRDLDVRQQSHSRTRIRAIRR